jgi:hypothetical protein
LAALFVAVVLGVVFADPLGWRASPAAREPDAADGAEDDWLLDEPDPGASAEPGGDRPWRRREGEGGRREGWGEGAGWPGGRRPEPGSPEWEAWRAERAERWRRAVDIAPLGPNPPAFDADAVREALRPGRDAMRACVEEAGGFEALREAVRVRTDQSGEPRARPTASFDVGPDGAVVRSSIAIQPEMPDAYRRCFVELIGSARLPAAGDGARVEMPLRALRGRRGRGGDAGVP